MKWRVLFILSAAELLAMALWFSATAVVPALAAEWRLSGAEQAWLTMSVQAGFVAGTLLSAFLNLADLIETRKLFFCSAVAGAALNAAIGLFVHSIEPAVALRFLTGVALAGVYPPGMKIMATWFKESRGLAIGVLVGALTLGSAGPHLMKLASLPGWREFLVLASITAAAGGLLCLLFVTDGPFAVPGAVFDWRFALRSMTDRGVRLANFGYLGHMWELYAMWTWIPVFLFESFSASGLPEPGTRASAAAFAVIGAGLAGCVLAGYLADRFGRTTVTIWSMVISGTCCLIAGPLFGGNVPLLTLVTLVWGITVVADSAQFSAAVTELTDPQYIGTTLTVQTCLGFLLTIVSIRLVPAAVDLLTWRWAFALLAIGPVFGIWSMYRLKLSPFAAKLGGEQRTPRR